MHLPVARYVLLITAVAAQAGLQLPSLFSDNMVIQQKKKVPLWGRTAPGAGVKATLGAASRSGKADAAGAFRLDLPAQVAGGPLTLKIASGTDSITIKNVLIGEVWLCSGQSNMEWPVRNAMHADSEIAAAQYPLLRYFAVARNTALAPQDSCQGAWLECSPNTVDAFSAVGYFFGRTLLKECNVPIGLINASWSGTNAESWMSREALKADTLFEPILARAERFLKDTIEAKARYLAQFARFHDSLEALGLSIFHLDQGDTGAARGWQRADYADSAWPTMKLPGTWEKSAGLAIDGIVWFRRQIAIPSAWLHKPLALSLGPIDDCDSVWVNGTLVGFTDERTPQFWSVPRRYRVPSEVVASTSIFLAVRVFDRINEGGFTGILGDMFLRCENCADETHISLAGSWKYAIGKACDPSKAVGDWGPGSPQKPLGPNDPNFPSTLFNGMINPLAPFPIAGAIWYQGENNTGRAWQYRKLLPALIADWRARWRAEFPFGIVSLANYKPQQPMPTESDWAELREAQWLTSLQTPHTGIAMAIDIGEAENIHPKNKQEVGRRLALWALATRYKRSSLEYSGPQYRSWKARKDTAVIALSHAKGLNVHGDTLKGFAIAGPDSHFVWAKAEIAGNALKVWSTSVAKPIAIRYNWADNPVGNLYNGAGLPAVPFRTDDRPGITYSAR